MRGYMAKRVAGGLGALVLAGAGLGTASAAGETERAGVLLVSKMSNQCLEVRGGNLGDGGSVAMWSCTGSPGQRWSRSDLDYRNDHSGKCLDINDANGATGAGLNQWTCHGGSPQQWFFNGSELRNANNKCLTVPAANRFNGAAVVMWDCVGAADQQWQIG